ncbi:MAG: hypothetical protein U5K38_17145 [Woeseiaceae bacterium]|nr:hypothetical protein [Woeseiaceae bacterium]
MTRGPHPGDIGGLLTKTEAETAKEAVAELQGRDRTRLNVARNTFETADDDTAE